MPASVPANRARANGEIAESLKKVCEVNNAIGETSSRAGNFKLTLCLELSESFVDRCVDSVSGCIRA